jgi:hypothetical protein
MIDQGGSALARRDPQVRRPPTSAGLYDVLDLILDKGIVIDAFVRVSLVGIELVTVDARVVIASVDTYLRYAEGAEQLQLYRRSDAKNLPEFVGDNAKRKMATKGVEAAGRIFGGGDEDDEGEAQESEEQEGVVGKLAKGVRNVVGRLAHTVAGGGEEDDEKGRERQPQQRERRPERQQERPHRGNGSGKPAKAGARR